MQTILRTNTLHICTADRGKQPLLIISFNLCLAFRNYNSILGSTILDAIALVHEVEHSILPVSNLVELIYMIILYLSLLNSQGWGMKSGPARKVFNMHPQQVGERGSLPEAAQKCWTLWTHSAGRCAGNFQCGYFRTQCEANRAALNRGSVSTRQS